MDFQVSTAKMKLLMSSLDSAGLNTKLISEIKIFSSMNDHIIIQHQNYLFWKYLNYMYSLNQENNLFSEISCVFKPAKSRELIKSFILVVETWKFIEQIKSYSNLNIWRTFGFFLPNVRIQDIRYPTSKSVSCTLFQKIFSRELERLWSIRYKKNP